MKLTRSLSIYLLPVVCIVAACVSLLYSCARMGTPDGGLYDETPPKIVKTSPKNAAVNEHPKKIVLEFDEIVKLDNSQSVVVSPPQLEQPNVEAYGRKVTVELIDTLKPNTTYTIDFGNSISDNNEGNPFGDYAFTFSTGEVIDTFQVSGNVLDASNLEPIKDILVGLYSVDDDDSFDDSTFYRKPFERISHTDGSGHFVIKGLNKDTKYRIFALKDADQDYRFSQKSEMVAFTPELISSFSKPDIRPDTVWHDSIHYDSIVYKPFTHFYPDNITLLAFTEDGQSRQFLKSERPELRKFSFFFTAPHDSLPVIHGLNFNADDAFVIDANEGRDTINYWIRDSLIFNMDTLSMTFDYWQTDSMGVLQPTTSDTLALVSKVSYDKVQKEIREKQEEWVKQYKKEHRAEIRDKRKELKEQGVKVTSDSMLITIPPMPETCMEMQLSNSSSLAPDRNIDFTFPEPLDSIDYSKIQFRIKKDSLFYPTKYLFKPVEHKKLTYRFYAEWKPDSTFELVLDTGAFVSIYGKRSENLKRVIKVKPVETFASLKINMRGVDSSVVVQLLNGSDQVVKTTKPDNGAAYFYFVNPGAYFVRAFLDLNGNGKWDTGEYLAHRQAEPMYYMPKQLPLKANWDTEETWAPTEKERTLQKPEKITKQKPDKEKKIKNRNADKLAEWAKRKKK